MRNIKLKLTYDGTAYLGWQKTNMGPSIEGTIEGLLSQILQHSIYLQAASRTDAGVHAVGQVANFFTSKDMSLEKLKYSLNCMLPKDIAINDLEDVPLTFHPTLHCKSKEYHYHLCYGRIQMPHERHYAWHYPRKLAIDAIKEVIPLLIGEHDFSAFCNTQISNTYAHYHRCLQSLEVCEMPNECLRFEIRGNNFLYKMVRNLVGTLTFVGSGKIDQKRVIDILLSLDRTQAGITAPALGLFLHQVNYS